jgi:hypothetical protein
MFDDMPVIRADGPVICFGGPYSNLQATDALLGEARRLGLSPSRIVCTGDVVAYCADAAATVDLVMASGIAAIAGNCEESLAAESADCGCGFDEGTDCDLLARIWYAHAAREMTPRHRAWDTPPCRTTRRRPPISSTSLRGKAAIQSPAPSWRSWRRCYGDFTTPARGAASHHTKPSPRRPSAPAQSWLRR